MTRDQATAAMNAMQHANHNPERLSTFKRKGGGFVDLTDSQIETLKRQGKWPPPEIEMVGTGKHVGLGQATWEGWALAGGLGLAGGLLGAWIGGKKHRALGAGVGAVAGVVVTPVLISTLIGFRK